MFIYIYIYEINIIIKILKNKQTLIKSTPYPMKTCKIMKMNAIMNFYVLSLH